MSFSAGPHLSDFQGLTTGCLMMCNLVPHQTRLTTIATWLHSINDLAKASLSFLGHLIGHSSGINGDFVFVIFSPPSVLLTLDMCRYTVIQYITIMHGIVIVDTLKYSE